MTRHELRFRSDVELDHFRIRFEKIFYIWGRGLFDRQLLSSSSLYD